MQGKTIALLLILTSLSWGASIQQGIEVSAYFLGTDADWDSHIRLGALEFFPNHTTAPGTKLNLGTWTLGELKEIELVVDTVPYVWGLGTNSDGQQHAKLSRWEPTPLIPIYGVLLSWEDWPGGGDFDYNDHQFVLAGRSCEVPEPGTMLMIAMGLGAVWFLKR